MLYDSKQWKDDIETVLSNLNELDSIAGKSILITGAAGLICSAVVDIIFRYNDTHQVPIHIYAAGRWPEEMEGRFGKLVERKDFSFVKYDASKTDNDIKVSADYIIHGASNAFPSMIVKEPVETMLSNVMGIKYLLDYAKDNGTKRILYISSSEVYGLKEENEPFREGEYGFIDILNPRNSYSIGKRAAETMCASYADEYGVESVIVRPGHIYGPTASPNDNRVSSAWAYQAARREDIVMKSEGLQLRSYCYCLDCSSAILKVLLNGNNMQAYNISNPDSVITIKQLAEIITQSAGVKLKTEIPSNEEKKGFNPMLNSSLEAKGLIDIGWKGFFDAYVGISHTVSILRESVIEKS